MKHLKMASALWLLVCTGLVLADEGCEKPAGYCADQCQSCAPAICRGTAKCEPVKKECFFIEHKQICIPAITFPWETWRKKKDCCGGTGCIQCCATPKCGRVITVQRLKKHEYECGFKCVCDWKIEPACLDGYCKPPCADCVPGAEPSGSSMNELVPAPIPPVDSTATALP